MKQASVKEKIIGIQAELEILKRALIKKPDFDIDEKNWSKVKSSAKTVRKDLYRKQYAK